MKKFRIYPIIILAMLLIAFLLPRFFKDTFAKPVDRHSIYYSPIDESFIRMVSKKGLHKKQEYSNLNGSITYNLEKHKSKLPFIYYSDLLKINIFPEKFMAFAQNPITIRKEKSYLKIKPEMISTNIVKLFPLMESQPKYSSLELPKDLFRLDKKGMTFLISESKSIDEEKSKLYNEKLKEKGAVFPLIDAFGNPSTRKPFDEGYFILDSKYNVFHIKQVKNKASINKINTDGIKTKFILMKENNRKEYYGAIVDKDNNIYLIMYGDYELVKLPIKNFNYKEKTFRFMTTPINRVITIESIDKVNNEKVIETIVTNLDYELIKENIYKYSLSRGETYEIVKSVLLPFKISLIKDKNGLFSFEIRDISKNSFIIYALLALCLLIYVKLSNRKIKTHIIPIILIASTGIYAIIVLILFNKLLTNKGQK